MAALTAPRNTPARPGEGRALPVKADTLILQGSIVVLDGSVAAPGRTAAGLIGLGRASTTVDNRGGAAGDKTIDVEAGVFRYDNKEDDALALADIGDDVFCVDDQTVAKTSATNIRSVIGKVFDVDADGVWVRFS